MSDETAVEVTTEAFEVLVGFNAVSKGDTLHLPVPLDEHGAALVSMGLIRPVGQPVDMLGQVLISGLDGENQTLLGVMSTPVTKVANRGRTRRTLEERVADMDKAAATDGEADS